MKKTLKRIAYFLAALLTVGMLLLILLNEPLPEGEKGPHAEALAQKMSLALRSEAFEQTRFLEWEFSGIHTYRWDRQQHTAEVKWKDFKVLLDLNDYNNSEVWQDKTAVSDTEERQSLIRKAVDFFNNDSFWLAAPYKIYDQGVERRLVTTDEGNEALLVTYTSGGSTPGDSYLWILDEQGFPMAFKMWVKIIPVGGLKAGWGQWTTTDSGAFLPTGHRIFLFDLALENVKGYGSMDEQKQGSK